MLRLRHQGKTVMQALLEYMLKALISHPEELRITQYVDQHQNLVLEIFVNSADRGAMIGRQGATLNAIEEVLVFYAQKNNLSKPNLKIIG